MDITTIFKLLWTERTWFDIAIIVFGLCNCCVFLLAKKEAGIIYRHFSRTDWLSALPEDSARNIRAVTGEEILLSPTDLLQHREKMNARYAAFTTITTMFPLLGILGTVMSLLPMVNSVAVEEPHLFFGALTSTFWGIVWALFCKSLDIMIGYKIEDSEKHMEFLLNPKRTEELTEKDQK